jgi:hypothetical protein
MPNWCFSSYVAEGPKEQIQRLEDMMVCLDAMPGSGLIENDFGANWLGNIVAALGGDYNEVRCRGYYTEVTRDDETHLSFFTETAWAEADGTRHLIEEKFPGVKLYYISEEFGCEYWVTNDVNSVYFDERYYFYMEGFDGDDGNYYSSLKELIKAVERATGIKGAKTFEDVQDVLEQYVNASDVEDYALYQIEFEE